MLVRSSHRGHVLAVALAGAPAGADAAAPFEPPPVAHAAVLSEPPPVAGVRLRWHAPAGTCPAEGPLQARVQALVDGSTQGLDAVAVVVAPRSAEREGRWRLDLRLRWAGGTDDRVLHAGDCAALADATVVLVAVLAAPLAASRRLTAVPARTPDAPSWPPAPAISTDGPLVDELDPPEPLLSPSSVLPAPASPPPVSLTSVSLTSASLPPASPVSPSLPQRRGTFARVAGVAGWGALLPGGDFGVALALGGLLRRVRLEGAATFLPARARTLADGTGGTMALAAGALRACPRLLGPTLELSLCGAVEAGASWSRSVGVTPPRRSAGPWFALALGGALDWWFSPQIALHLGVDVLFAPVTTRYALGEQDLFGSRQVLVRGALGLTFSLAQQKPREAEKQRR